MALLVLLILSQITVMFSSTGLLGCPPLHLFPVCVTVIVLLIVHKVFLSHTIEMLKGRTEQLSTG